MHARVIDALVIAAVALLAPRLDARQEVEPSTLDADAPVSAVTVYRGRAAVTRRIVLDLDPGAYDVRFERLPASIQPDTLQARSSRDVTILGVDYDEMEVTESASPELAALDQRIRELRLELEDLAGRDHVVEAQETFLDSIAERAAGDAGEAGGTERLDLEAVREQLEFIAEQRTRLLEIGMTIERAIERASGELAVLQARRIAVADSARVARTAVVSAVVTTRMQATIDLSYLVADASWAPAYRVRASLDGAQVTIDYDAVVTQRSGEDWNDVAMTLSTAQPMLAANPPDLKPAYVDLIEPALRRPAAAARAPAADADVGARFKALEGLTADAAVGGAGPSVTYGLPRPVTVKSNVQSRQQTRIARIETSPDFIHFAVPLLSDAVYIRAELTNNSQYLLLPGRASIFLEQDFVGPTQLDTIAPQETFELYFGIDPAIQVSRRLLRKSTAKTGLLAGGRETSYAYRIEVDNGTGKTVNLELWDRYPVSRSDQIVIELVDMSLPLATDAEYINEDRPRGLLKWFIAVPPTSRGQRALAITYGVKINRDKDVLMTELPE